MLRFLKKSFLARFQACGVLPGGRRRGLSNSKAAGYFPVGTGKALVESVRPLAADREIPTPEAAKTNKQIKFVDGLYKSICTRLRIRPS